MANIAGFDATKVEPSQPFEPLPAGDYKCVIESSELKPTKTGGERIALTLQVIEGQHKGRKFFDGLNIRNTGPNKATVEAIAQRTLSSICHAVGVLQPQDTVELHNRPLLASVKIVPYDGGFTNQVKGYSSTSGKKPKATKPDHDEYSEPITAEEVTQQTPALDEDVAPWD